jgi:hypothetical protein
MQRKRLIIEVVGGCVLAAYGDDVEYLVLDFDNLAAGELPPDPTEDGTWQLPAPLSEGLAACSACPSRETLFLAQEPARYVSSPTLALRAALTNDKWRSLRVSPVEQIDGSCRELACEESYLADFWTVYGTDQNGHSYALADFTTRRLAQSAIDAALSEPATGELA